MHRTTMAGVLILWLALGGTVAMGTLTTQDARAFDDSSDQSAVADLGAAALAFVSEEDISKLGLGNLLKEAILTKIEEPVAFNPFKGDVTYDADTADTATIAYTFAFALNAGDTPTELPYEAETLHGFAGDLSDEFPGSTMLPPAFPPGTSYTFDEFFDALVEDMGLGPDGPTTLDNGAEVQALWPEGFGQGPPTGPIIYVLGARTVAPRSFDCPGLMRTSGVVFDTPLENLDETTAPGIEQFNSYNYAIDTKLVARCEGGSERGPLLREVFQGLEASSLFSEDPAAAGFISGPYGWVVIVPGDDIPDATAMRTFEFVTDLMAPFDADYTAASAVPSDLTILWPLSMIPHVYYEESLIVPPTTSTVTTTSTVAAAAPSTDDASEAPVTTQAALSPTPDLSSTDTSGGPGWPLWVGLGGLALLGAGGYTTWQQKRRDAAVAVASGTLPSSGMVDGDPGDLSLEDLSQYAGADLEGYTDVYDQGTGPPVVVTTTDEDWLAFLDTEPQIQDRYMGDFKNLLEDIAARYNAYHAAITRFKEAFVRIMSGSTEMQAYLQQWADTKKIAEKQDLAFGVIMLVWGVGSLGLKAFRWLATPKVGVGAEAAAATVEAAVTGTERAAAGAESTAARVAGSADELAAAETVLGEAATVIDKPRAVGQLDAAYKAYATEAGIDVEKWFARYGANWEQAHVDLIKLVARNRGWHGITAEAEGILNRLLVNGRSAVAGGGATINPGDIAKLRQWASQGGFWDRLLTTGGMLEDGAVLFYNADDVKFLRALMDCEGDLAKLRPLLGPAQETALGVAGQVPGLGAVLGGTAGTGIDAYSMSGSAGSVLFGAGSMSGMDLTSYTDEFGGWASEVEEGFGSAMLAGVWGVFTSPFETYHGITMTIEALDKYNKFLEGHGDDLLELSSSLTDALNELDRLRRAIDNADLDDPTSSLGGKRAQELRGLMGQMDEMLGRASDDWKAQHGDEVGERKAHISRKVADTTRMLSGFQGQLGRIGQMHEWLDGLRKTPDGSLREATSLWNPELVVRLASVDLALKGIIGSALLGGSSPNPPSAPPGERPMLPDPFADDQNPFEELDAMDDAAYEEEWESEMDDLFPEFAPGED